MPDTKEEPTPEVVEPVDDTAQEEILKEDGDTVSASYVPMGTWQARRWRRLNMLPHAGLDNGSSGDLRFPDASPTDITFTHPVPYDWVYGTNLRFCWVPWWFAIGGADQRALVWDSDIRLVVANRGLGTGRTLSALGGDPLTIENLTGLTTQVYRDEPRYIIRVIDETAIENVLSAAGSPARDFDWFLQWNIGRDGGNASDTVNTAVALLACWFEYQSTYDYPHIPRD